MVNVELIDNLQRPSFWRSLAPQWSVGETEDALPYGGPLLEFPEPALARQRRLIRREGYLRGSTTWGVDPQPMAQLIRQLAQLGIPPVFAFVYDAYWLPFFQLHHLISGLLGGRYHMLPDCWIWNVDPTRQGTGWAPHRDRNHQSLRPDGSPKIINIWIPLSPATPLNSCIYVLPADRDPVYGTSADSKTSVDLSSIRALPADPGDFLIWNQAVLHWGSQSSTRAPESRVSMAWEFQRVDEALYSQPVLPILQWPKFQDRILMIAHQILHFASPGFFAKVDDSFMQWAAAVNPQQAQRRQISPHNDDSHPAKAVAPQPGQTATLKPDSDSMINTQSTTTSTRLLHAFPGDNHSTMASS